MLRLMKDGERPRPPDCGTGRAPLPATMACAALRPLRAFPTGTRHVFKQLLLDRQLRRAPTTRGAGSRVGGRLLLRRPVSARDAKPRSHALSAGPPATSREGWDRSQQRILAPLAPAQLSPAVALPTNHDTSRVSGAG